MASRTFADLSPYRKRVEDAQKSANLLDSLIGGVQQGIQLQQLPQTLQDQQINNQLQRALMQQKLYDLQNPQEALARELQKVGITEAIKNPQSGIIQTPAGLTGQTIATPQAIPQTASSLEQALTANPSMPVPSAAPTLPIVPLGVGRAQTGLSLDQNIPAKAEEDKFNRELKRTLASRSGATALHFTKVGNDLVGLDPITGEEIKRIPVDPSKKTISTKKGVWVYDEGDPEGGHYLSGTEPDLKSNDLTPGQVITAKREVRATYDELPSKIAFFGKGQVPGSNQLKNQLDAVLNPVKGDFSKLNPQAKKTFVFAMNKLRDPTSATLTTEAQLIANQAGLGDRLKSFIENYKSGDDLPDQVAKDIYQVVSQIEALHKDDLINQLVELKQDTDSLGVKLTSIGVPKSLQDEVEKRIKNPAQPTLDLPTVQPIIKKTTLSSQNNFGTEQEARAAGFQNGDMVIINGIPGNLE